MNNTELTNNLLPVTLSSGTSRTSVSSDDSANLIDFAVVLASDIIADEKFSQPKGELSVSDITQLDGVQTSGNGLPVAAEIAVGELSSDAISLLQNAFRTEQINNIAEVNQLPQLESEQINYIAGVNQLSQLESEQINYIAGVNQLSQLESDQTAGADAIESDPQDVLSILEWALNSEQITIPQGMNALPRSDFQPGPIGNIIADVLKGRIVPSSIPAKNMVRQLPNSVNASPELMVKALAYGTELSSDEASVLFKNMVTSASQSQQSLATMTTSQAALPNMISSMEMQSLGKSEATTPPPISIQVGEKGWDNLLGNRIMWMLGKEVQSASVKVTPRHLGPIELHVAVKNDQASVTLLAQNVVAKEALEAALPRLREMFSETNMQLVNVDVGQRNAQQDRASSFFQQSDSNGEKANGQLFGQDHSEESEKPLTEELTTGLGLVDDYA